MFLIFNNVLYIVFNHGLQLRNKLETFLKLPKITTKLQRLASVIMLVL